MNNAWTYESTRVVPELRCRDILVRSRQSISLSYIRGRHLDLGHTGSVFAANAIVVSVSSSDFQFPCVPSTFKHQRVGLLINHSSGSRRNNGYYDESGPERGGWRLCCLPASSCRSANNSGNQPTAIQLDGPYGWRRLCHQVSGSDIRIHADVVLAHGCKGKACIHRSVRLSTYRPRACRK